jgi:glycine/D-amino acid oxidase-like deaminating enzyme
MLSIWEQGHFHKAADLVVVGGGITGLFTALFHKRRYPSHHVLVLEKGVFPAGASVKNAGFACFGSPSELLADMALEGDTIALARVEERWKGLLALRQELGDDSIRFEPCGGYEIYADHDPLYTRVVQGFDGLNSALRSIFGREAYKWDDGAIARFGFSGVHHAVHTDLEGGLDSGALMRTLLRKAQGEGVLLRTGATVDQIEEGPGAAELALSDGTRQLASQVVVATNGYASSLLPQTGILPARGQVLLTSPISGLRPRGTFHLDEGFYYFRDLGNAVLLGGGRNLDIQGETTMLDGITSPIQEALERLLRETILPGEAFTIVDRWSGIMGFRAVGKEPLVERLSDRICVAAGLSGMGVAIGIRVARRAADLVDERS